VPVVIAIPAMLPNLWPQLMLLAGTTAGILNGFFRAVGFAQWFIKHGTDHPFDAIGMIASAIVLVVVALLQGVAYLVL
jgi:hypothetical protein